MRSGILVVLKISDLIGELSTFEHDVMVKNEINIPKIIKPKMLFIEISKKIYNKRLIF
jgi:hypothetical protein